MLLLCVCMRVIVHPSLFIPWTYIYDVFFFLLFFLFYRHKWQVENSLSTYEPHGCVVVYSVVQRASFRHAEEIVKYLWRENVPKDKAVILVGNKADLARSRVIPTSEGKALAKSIDAKFIETSSGIQHNVDELLVGILKQVSRWMVIFDIFVRFRCFFIFLHKCHFTHAVCWFGAIVLVEL